jgi:heme-degrading monooxygenase HmoA
MGDIYTVGIWTVKPGREHEFVRLWSSLGTRTLEDHPGSVGTLLRDRRDPRRFVSFGPWDSLEEVEEWRGSAAFQETVGELGELLEHFEPGTFDLVLRVGLTSEP